ncbi:hypothetical protein AF331_19255 [Rossellomorea marisflavi]|uniref:Uncharacterized protein n=1 Tax=Rossellomorea marisflavi TaxID=189381 RepID=A0A0M0FZK9_9BACI|nr:hypothetical protein [Rossellomorea marisflavi]KON82980.1 hypothetical protein AF331_19255 [Rossellomorea marisflavi]
MIENEKTKVFADHEANQVTLKKSLLQKASIHTNQSEEQRRVDDSCGKRGKVETLEAQPKRLSLPPRRKAGGRSGAEHPLLNFSKALKRPVVA